ncbi:MAG: esterase-like activity of phytase family protein [Pseudomonadota bacterium]
MKNLRSVKFNDAIAAAFLAGCLALSGLAGAAPASPTLIGRAVLPADTFAEGPTSGQFITGNTNGRETPFYAAQPVQGFSAVLAGRKRGTYLVMSDNGFGAKANSADYVLRIYGVEPDFREGKVYPVDLRSGLRLASFSRESFLEISDPKRLTGFPIVAEQSFYPNGAGGIAVDPAIADGRLLTGADFDLESFRRARDNSFWFGEEFGPFLLHTDSKGRMLDEPIPLPNFKQLGVNSFVQSPDNPFLAAPELANLPRSRGFEGMALNASRTKLYAMLEGPLTADPDRSRLLIHEFDLHGKRYTGKVFHYRMEHPTGEGQAIGDLTAINDHEFLVIERDGRQGDPNNPAFTDPARFKRIYKIDIGKIDPDGFVEKRLLVDLLNISDPGNVGGNGTRNGIFTFPFVTIESVLPVGSRTLLVINDNNYPFSVGRTPGQPDDNEFILVRLAEPLHLRSCGGRGHGSPHPCD